MEHVERLFALAVEAGHLSEHRVKSLLSLVSMRRGDVHTAGELLTTYHSVSAEVVAALVKEALTEPEPEPEPEPASPSGALIAPKASPSGALIAPKGAAPAASEVTAEVAEVEEELVEFELVEDDVSAPVAVAATARGVSASAGERAAPDQPLDENAQAVLIVYPVADPTKAQLNAFSDALGVILYEARLRMAQPLPRLADGGPASRLLPKLDRLREANVPCLCVEHEALFPKLRSHLVTAVNRDGFALDLTLTDSWGDDAAPGQTHTLRLDLDRPRLLVIGRYDFEAKGSVKHSSGLGTRKKIYRTQSNEFVPFGHLYYDDSDTPIEFNDDALKDFTFLADEKTFSERQNLYKLLDMIAPGRAATRNELLKKHAGRVKDSASSAGSIGGREASNVAKADALSRAIYFKWVAQL